jgi:protein-histidine N-methyltransferase
VQLEALPSLISYSPLVVPLSSGNNGRKTNLAPSLTLARRDLFDARFQLISEGTEDETNATACSEKGMKPEERTKALQFLDAPSDLVPGLYEGGLKTWECSLDLVDYLDSSQNGDMRGKHVLEVRRQVV